MALYRETRHILPASGGSEREAADLLKRGKAKAINQREKWDDDDSETRGTSRRLAALNRLAKFKMNIKAERVPPIEQALYSKVPPLKGGFLCPFICRSLARSLYLGMESRGCK